MSNSNQDFSQTRNSKHQYDAVEIFKCFQNKINRELRVASLAKVTEVKDQYVNAVYYPVSEKDSSLVINAWNISKLDLKINDIVLIIFLDRAFQNYTDDIDKNSPPVTSDVYLHSLSFGVVIAKNMWKEETTNE